MSNAFSAKLVKFLKTLDRLRQARGAGLEPAVQMDLRERLEELLEQLSDAEQKIAEANAWRSHPDQFRERLYREARARLLDRVGTDAGEGPRTYPAEFPEPAQDAA